MSGTGREAPSGASNPTSADDHDPPTGQKIAGSSSTSRWQLDGCGFAHIDTATQSSRCAMRNTLCQACPQGSIPAQIFRRLDRGTPSFVGTYYAIVAILAAYASDPNPSDLMMQIGTALFGIGIAGNFYHHYLLARLRKSPGKDGSGSTTEYVAPRDGLFDYVAAPHYLFKLMGWLGMAIVSNHLNVYLVFTSMSSYLSGRSVAQNEFNRKKFAPEDWPEDRKNLIPFVF